MLALIGTYEYKTCNKQLHNAYSFQEHKKELASVDAMEN